jgi:hypothetical protein
MSEEDKGVARFLETFGGIMIGAGFEWLIFIEHPSAVVVSGFIGGGILVFFAGIYWEWVKQHIPTAVTESVEKVASDIRYWMAFVLVAWLSLLFLSAVQKLRVNDTLLSINENVGALRADMKQMRADFNCYVKPRRLRAEQISAIAKYLSAHDPQEVTIKVVSNDNEAGEFSSDIGQALRQGGWTVVMSQLGSDPCVGVSFLSAGQAEIPSYCLTSGNGVLCTQVLANGNPQPTPAPLVCSRVAEKGSTPEGGTTPCAQFPCFAVKGVGNATFTWQQASLPIPTQEGWTTIFLRAHWQDPPDPKHPDSQTLLTEAFRSANVQMEGGSGGGGNSITKDSLSIIIGHRRRDGYGPGCPQTRMTVETVPAPVD